MSKLAALWNLFRQGQSVADPALWKKRQINATLLGAVILAVVNVAHSFGYTLPIDMDTANAIAGGIIGLVNVLLTMTTTDKIGLAPLPDPVAVPAVVNEEPKEIPVVEQAPEPVPDYHSKL